MSLLKSHVATSFLKSHIPRKRHVQHFLSLKVPGLNEERTSGEEKKRSQKFVLRLLYFDKKKYIENVLGPSNESRVPK